MISLTYRDGPAVFIPDALVQQDSNGRKWLRLRPSSPVISKLVVGHLAQFRHLKIQVWQHHHNYASSKRKSETDSVLHFAHSSGENMFGEPEPDSEASNKPKDKKGALENAPDIVMIRSSHIIFCGQTTACWDEFLMQSIERSGIRFNALRT